MQIKDKTHKQNHLKLQTSNTIMSSKVINILLGISSKHILASWKNQNWACPYPSVSAWVSSFLTAHQHNIGYAVPYY